LTQQAATERQTMQYVISTRDSTSSPAQSSSIPGVCPTATAATSHWPHSTRKSEMHGQ